MNPLYRYIDDVMQYVVKYGENASWSPLLINKVFLQIMIELGIIAPFSIGRNPVISQTQKQLYEDYNNGIISSNPRKIFDHVDIKSKNNLSDYEINIDTISESLHELNLPYIWNSNKLKSKIQQIGGNGNSQKTNHIERMVDGKILGWRDNCNNLDYIHPKIESNINYINSIKDLEELCDVFAKLKTSETLRGTPILSDREKYVLQKIKEDGFKYEHDTIKSVKPTDPCNSALKEGKIDNVINFRYLEFLREKNEDGYKSIIINNSNEKFVIALGKISKEKVFPSWAELYFFNVSRKSEDEIADLADKLEQYMVLILANKFFIHESWKAQINRGTNNLKRELLEPDENEMLNQLGKYGGEVCIASLCLTKDTVNFPTSEIKVKEYITNVYIQLIKALGDLRIYSIIKNNTEITILESELEKIKHKDIFYKLRFLKERLNRIYYLKLELGEIDFVGLNIKRPIYIFDLITENKINCEGFVALSLFLIFNNPAIFPLNNLKINICCAPLDFLQEILSDHPDRTKITQGHMFIIFESGKEKLLFDPTNITRNFESRLINSILSIDSLYIETKNIIIERE